MTPTHIDEDIADRATMTLASPIGPIELTGSATAVMTLSVASRSTQSDSTGTATSHPAGDTSAGRQPSVVLERAARQLEEYFSGHRKRFRLPLSPKGTPFQRQVWDRIAALRWGEQISYGAIAADIGMPGASRAIGAAVAANPLPIIIGCHRVLSSTGHVIGYTAGDGIPTKLWLLRHEGVLLAG